MSQLEFFQATKHQGWDSNTKVMTKNVSPLWKTFAYHYSYLKQLLEPMWPLVTYQQDKLAKKYFRFKKIEEIIHIYQEICKRHDKRFQSVHGEGVRLPNKLGAANKLE